MLDKFKNENTFCFGDLNARFGDPHSLSADILYTANPDTVINSNGKTLKKIVQNMSYNFVNGMCLNHTICDSDFSYFRG